MKNRVSYRIWARERQSMDEGYRWLEYLDNWRSKNRGLLTVFQTVWEYVYKEEAAIPLCTYDYHLVQHQTAPWHIPLHIKLEVQSQNQYSWSCGSKHHHNADRLPHFVHLHFWHSSQNASSLNGLGFVRLWKKAWCLHTLPTRKNITRNSKLKVRNYYSLAGMHTGGGEYWSSFLYSGGISPWPIPL